MLLLQGRRAQIVVDAALHAAIETAPPLHDAAQLCAVVGGGGEEAPPPEHPDALRALNFERFRLLIEGARCGYTEEEHVTLAAARILRAARSAESGAPRRARAPPARAAGGGGWAQQLMRSRQMMMGKLSNLRS